MESIKKIMIGLLAVLGLALGLGIPTPQPFSQVETVQASHQVKLQGAHNVRDLGGYRTATKQKVKPRLLLRSAKLAGLTHHDKQLLVRRYHLKTVIDLRTPAVIARTPDAKIPGVRFLKAPVVSDKTMASVNRVAVVSGTKSMEKLYRSFVTTTQARHAYRQLFLQLLKAPGNRATLWHCSEGKDRTGFGTALVLTVLGVPQKTVYQDYLASNTYNKKSVNRQLAVMKRQGASERAISQKRDTLVVKKAYLEAAYQAADKKYGSIQNYLSKGLGLSKQNIIQLRHHYLMK
ncbi:protein tyrosine phosphatase [Secundilactobacillus pentosiphilus]|uniref:Protein tyrosine phosphatase n=1 Tax=Secundilactobacillus pentosiphilus TaxID=1714682 RepID=A0A1Z5IVV1_9LACO|nr:tyrosine-protein phosphatase [Secundilactobacillus pentosiphilus]GAX05728.1 protein tyrosine phosphatase [Secundilactobacillus pentosiphilus]